MTSYSRNYLTLSAHQKPTVGDTKTSVINYDHMGWILCDGRTLSKAEFNFLFQVIGYSFGGSGNNFTIPDPQGRVLGIVGTGTDTNERSRTGALGDVSGEYDHQLTIAEMPTHNHGGLTDLSGTGIYLDNSGAHAHGLDRGNNGINVAGSANVVLDGGNDVYTASAGLHNHTVNDPTHRHGIENQGLSHYHNNVQPTLFIGNLFIYTGLPNYGNYPYTANTNVL